MKDASDRLQTMTYETSEISRIVSSANVPCHGFNLCDRQLNTHPVCPITDGFRHSSPYHIIGCLVVMLNSDDVEQLIYNRKLKHRGLVTGIRFLPRQPCSSRLRQVIQRVRVLKLSNNMKLLYLSLLLHVAQAANRWC